MRTNYINVIPLKGKTKRIDVSHLSVEEVKKMLNKLNSDPKNFLVYGSSHLD